MSNTPVQDPPAQEMSSGSEQTLPSRPFPPMSEPSTSKRVCFYKSGDYKFSGHRMVINARTFKTFDALLDALSKKVPLPFGVRTITTPRGTHLVRALDDLHDGGSYVCSDQRRVKPLNLEEVNRRQVPWNTTRPFSSGRRRRQGVQVGRRSEAVSRPAKVTERVAVRTPKKLVVIKNRDPTVKRTIVLQRRTAPTFDALLDYLSQILQFPVLKLFSTDGRRVDGLAALILCSGVVVAAGNEPFRLGNYNFHRTGQMAQAMYMDTVEPSMLQPRAQNHKSLSSGRGSRNFSLSSEKFIVDQVNKSRSGSMNSQMHRYNRSSGTEGNHPRRVDAGHPSFIIPEEDDIEKSFRVNQDGSMTVEMKVHLTIKEEEMLHWTTTVSRSSLTKRTVCASVSGSGNSSPDSNNAVAKDSSSISEDEAKEENRSAGAGKGVGFNAGSGYESCSSTPMGKAAAGFKRAPTPGPRHIKKKASVESVKTVTESGVQESSLGHYSYMERTAGGETTEEYCVVRHSSSNRPIPKPRKTASAGAAKKGIHSSIRSSGVAEVLQIQNNGMEITETVMHIYEREGCYDNYFPNEENVLQHGSSPHSEVHSSSNDNDIDFSTTDSLQRPKEEMLSLSSEPITATGEITNQLSSAAENDARTATNSQRQRTVKKVKVPKSEKEKKSQKSSTSTSGSDKKQKENKITPPKLSKHSAAEKNSSNTSIGKKSLSSSESAKKVSKDEKVPRKEQALSANSESVKRTLPQRHSGNKVAAKYNGHNVNTPTARPQMKKNISDILQPKKSLLPGRKTVSKPKSMSENRTPSPKKASEISESFSMPSLNPSRSDIHQYVENWLEKVTPDTAPYIDEPSPDEPQPRANVVFQIGADSDSDEKTEGHANLDEDYASSGDAIKKSSSCLSVPLCQGAPSPGLLHAEQHAKGLCVSMPSVRADPARQENKLRAHKSAEVIGTADSESSSSTSNVLSPKAKIKPALRQLCSSIQCIRRVSDTNISTLEKSSSLPDFPTQVATVFGSSCKAFLSFLSVMTLRDVLTGNVPVESNQARNPSEAMFMMESLQKISAIDDEQEQRASLADLQSRTSEQFRERWKDFQILRERLESEPLSPKVSETEFALDVVSEGGDVFDDRHMVIDELMEELNMPQDLRDQISSTIHARGFYPIEESTFVETERQSESEEDVEKFVEDCDNETKGSPEPDVLSLGGDAMQTKQDEDDAQETKLLPESELEPDKVQETPQAERDEPSEEKENEEEEQAEEVNEGGEGGHDDEDEGGNESRDDDDEETEKGEREKEEEESENMDNVEQDEWDADKVSEEEEEGTVDEQTEGMTIEYEEEGQGELKGGKTEAAEDTDKGCIDEEDGEERKDSSAEDTDEREGEEEADKEEKGGSEVVEDADEEENEHEAGAETEMNEEEVDADEVVKGTEEGEEVDNITVANEEEEKEEEEEVDPDAFTLQDEAEESVEEREEEEMLEVVEDKEEGENLNEEMEEEEEEEEEEKEQEEEEEERGDVVTETDVEDKDIDKREELEGDEAGEETDAVTEKDAEMELEDDEVEEDEAGEETDAVTEKDAEMELAEEEVEEEEAEEEDGEDAEEQEDEEVGSEENEEKGEEEEEEEDREQEQVQDSEDALTDTERRVVKDEEEDEDEAFKNVEEQEGEESGTERRKRESSAEEESVGEIEMVEEIEETREEQQTLDEEEREDEEEFDEGLELVEEAEVEDEGAPESIAGHEDCKVLLDEAAYLQGECCEEEAEEGAHDEEHDTESSVRYFSEGQCEDDKGSASDAVTESETEQRHTETSSSLPHLVEISQELLDFVNSALQSSSLIFTYDAQGNIRIEPENARVVQTAQIIIPRSKEDSSYRLKCLPSPSTSDLSDYRPETSESGGYKSQDSVDVLTESGDEDSQKLSSGSRRRPDVQRAQAEPADSKLSTASNSEALQTSRSKSKGSHSSFNSSTKASKEDLSYFSGASSPKAEAKPATEATQGVSPTSGKDLTNGVLIDRGRWLLKENHLIRKSPPLSEGMYGNADSTSIDTGQENTSDESMSPTKSQHSPLAAISSSELEEMAKPQTPKCTYYNMPHGSDSDPFLDDSSFKSGKKDSSSVKGKGVRVSPTIDTTKTWASKNGSLSSFASVEFKMPDGKVHPEGEPSGRTQARGTSSGGAGALQAQDSLETLHVRCGQYCPIL